MWLALSLTAVSMLVLRRSTEKTLAGKIPATAMAWLQQAVGMPFMIALLPFATFYNPLNLPRAATIAILLYVALASLDVILYFKALELGDISIIAPLITLGLVTNLIGTYFILGQVPSVLGLVACGCILAGAYLAGRRKHSTTAKNNGLAVILVLIVVSLRGLHSALEVIALRETNPIYFNFLTSALGIPLLVGIMWLWLRLSRRRDPQAVPGPSLMSRVTQYRLPLAIIGITYTINLTCTYAAKVIAPNAAYVTSVKSSQVLPMVIVGTLFFHEHITGRQWVGVGIIGAGLGCFMFA